jgi:quinol monooxygenase YgiN
MESSDMSFIFMVLHWPEPGHREALAQSMREMRDALSGLPGCTSVEPPYLADDGTCLVGISKWESRQAFFASGMTLRPPEEIVEGETRPRQRFFLEEALP